MDFHVECVSIVMLKREIIHSFCMIVIRVFQWILQKKSYKAKYVMISDMVIVYNVHHSWYLLLIIMDCVVCVCFFFIVVDAVPLFFSLPALILCAMMIIDRRRKKKKWFGFCQQQTINSYYITIFNAITAYWPLPIRNRFNAMIVN